MSGAASQPPASSSRRIRLKLRFSLRTFLAAVTILCVAFGWRINGARRQREAVAAISAAGGFVNYDYQQAGGQAASGDWDSQAKPWEPERLHALVGIDFFHDVTGVFICTPPRTVNIAPQLAQLPRLRSLRVRGLQFDDASLRTTGRLKRLEYFVVTTTTITDDGIAQLCDLPRLRYVEIREAQLGDRSLQALARLPNLEHLEMEGDRLTDAGLAALVGHRRLKHLWIGMSPEGELNSIGDAGVAHLAKLPQLEVIGLHSTRVTPAGLAPLQTLPHLQRLSLLSSTADNYAAVAPLFPGCDVHCSKNEP